MLTHLIPFEKTGTNAWGATTGALTIYDQDKVVLTAQAFTGGARFSPIPNGTYMIRLDIRGVADSSADLKPSQDELAPFYGIQAISRSIIDSEGNARNGRYEWGSLRAALNEPAGETRRAYRGNFLHGKERAGDYTHGCICDRSEITLK